MREDNDNGNLCEAALERELFRVSFPLCLGSCLLYLSFLFRSGKARESRGRNSGPEWHEEAPSSCTSFVAK